MKIGICIKLNDHCTIFFHPHNVQTPKRVKNIPENEDTVWINYEIIMKEGLVSDSRP